MTPASLRVVAGFLGGEGGVGEQRHTQGKKNPIYRGKEGKIPSRSLFRWWRGSGLCPPLVRAAPFPAFCGFQHYLLSNFWRPSGDFWPRDGWLRPLGKGHGQVQPLRSRGQTPSQKKPKGRAKAPSPTPEYLSAKRVGAQVILIFPNSAFC